MAVVTRCSTKKGVQREFFLLGSCQTSEGCRSAGKEVSQMNMRKLTSAVILRAGTIRIGGTSARAGNVISKDVSTAGSYCHMKYPAMCEETFRRSTRVLKNSIFDFYGLCDRDPRDKDEIQAQRFELQHRFGANYAG